MDREDRETAGSGIIRRFYCWLSGHWWCGWEETGDGPPSYFSRECRRCGRIERSTMP